MALEAYQRESFSPSFTSHSIWIAIVYSHKKTIFKSMHELFELVMPLDPLDVFLWDSVTVWGRGIALNYLMTHLIYLYSCLHGLDGHGGISNGIVFSIFYLLQHLNSNCVFPQKDILKLMHELFELVMPLDPRVCLGAFLWDSVTVWGTCRGSILNKLMTTKYTFILVYMSLDGHGSVAKGIVFSLFYLPQYLNSNCVFSQKNNL